MKYKIKQEGPFKYYETEGSGETIMLLHGLFGALSNFERIIDHFGQRYKVVVPLLPIYDMPITKLSVKGLLEHVQTFIEFKNYKNIHVLGNSLGGHLALLFALSSQDRIRSLILTGSSGLFEHAFGKQYLKRKNYDSVKEIAQSTFFDPKVATKDMVDEVFHSVNDRNRGLRLIKTAKSAIRHNLEKKLHKIKVPTLLVWGKEDRITPLFVGKRFNELITTSTLVTLEKCGHAPMMELPTKFNEVMHSFIDRVSKVTKVD